MLVSCGKAMDRAVNNFGKKMGQLSKNFIPKITPNKTTLFIHNSDTGAFSKSLNDINTITNYHQWRSFTTNTDIYKYNLPNFKVVGWQNET
jgi:hypothetical protein